MSKVKVAAYCRVSTNSKDQRNSFENQKQYFEKIAIESEYYELVDIYADEGISGVRLNKRDDFLRMIHDAGVDAVKGKNSFEFLTDNNREPKFSKILIKDISRFSRNLDTIPLYRALVRKGVSLVLTNMGVEFATEADEFNLSMLLTFAQHESVDRSKKIRFGLQRSAEKGVVKIARQLYGYQYDPETKNVAIIEEEAKVVREIFDMYVNKNMGIRRIIQYLEDKEHKTRDGKKFGYSTVTRMISNRKYCGDMVYLKYDSGTVLNKFSSHKVKPEDEWVIHEDVMPSIITREIFEKAQEMKTKRTTKNGFKGVKYAFSQYSNLIVCNNCGAFYGRNKANGKYFYNCMTKKRYGVNKCDYPNVSEEKIEEIISSLANKQIHNSVLYQKNSKWQLLEELRGKLEEKIKDTTPPDVKEKENELANLNSQKEKLLDLYMEGNFDKTVLNERVSKLNREIEILTAEIKHALLPTNEIQNQIKEIQEQIDKISQVKVKESYTNQEVLEMLDSIHVEHVLNSITLTVKLKINETINKTIDNLIPELSDLKVGNLIFSYKAHQNIPIRMPKDGTLYMLRPDADVEKVTKEQEEFTENRIREYNAILNKKQH